MATNDFINQDYTLSPLDRAVISAVLATELGKTKYNTPQDRELVLNVLFNRHAFGPYTAFGSTYRDNQGNYLFPGSPGYLDRTGRPETLNTLANIGLKYAKDKDTGKLVSQFSGLQDLQKLYQSTLPVEEQIKQIEALMKDNEFYNEMFQYIDPYVKDRMAAGGKGVGETANAFNFINAMVEGDPRKNYDLWTASKSDRQLFGKQGNIPSGYLSPKGIKYAHIPFYNPLYVSGKYKLDNDPTIYDNKLRFNYLTGVPGETTTSIPLNSNTPQDPYNEIGIQNFNIDSSPSFDFFKPPNTNTVAPMYSPANNQEISINPVAPLNIIGGPPRDIRVPNQDDGGINQRMADEIFRSSSRALFNDGTPNVGNYGVGWSSTHNDMLTNAIEGLRNRFPEASNDEILTSLKNSNIVQDIQGQVDYMTMNPGSQLSKPPGSERLDVPSLENSTDTVPAMLTPGEAVIPAESAQLEKNQKVIKEFIEEGRELQDKKEELGIPPENQNFNEDLSKDVDKALAKVNKEDFRAKEEARLQGTLPEVNKPKSKYDVGFLDRLSEFGKNVFYPFGPGGLSNRTIKEKEEVQPKQSSTPPDYFEMKNLLNKQVPPPMQGPVKPEAIPQQYINDASDYTPKQKENQNKVVESLPSEGEPSYVPQQYINDASNLVLEDQQKGGSQFKDVTNWIEENLGFNKQDVFRGLLYYVGGRLSGGSHAGSLRWAGRQVIQESSARAKTQAAAAASNTLSKSQQLNYYKDLAKMFLKSPGLTPSAKRKLEKALAAGDIQSMADVINNTGGKFRTEIGMKADTTKPTEVFLKEGFEDNSFIVYPSTDGSGLAYYIDPKTQKVVGINQNKLRPFSAMVEDNIPSLVGKYYKGTDKNKLQSIFNIQGEGALYDALRNYAKEKNIPSKSLTGPMLSLLSGMTIPEGFDPSNPGDFTPEKGYKSLEAALDMVILSGGKQADLTKLENVNQVNVNKMVEDFGGPEEATKVLQAVDATLNAEPISPERVEAGIKNLTDKEKAVVAKQPNDYFKLLYMAYFSRKVKE